ncbi:MAG: PTS sorbitol transporter subunit IIA [Spirochaetes bacterium]|jgi:PTS system glucitol/sorbitol-specific IIA component|nr:PTS sorbitol transporter subunit IIA [Spirochaetota bacterium]
MAKTKYKTTVLYLGELASEFIDESIMVFFGQEAPEELHEHSVVHEEATGLDGEVEPGDSVIIDGQSYPVLAVGAVANKNIKSMGHLVLKFNGLDTPEMEGDVCLPEVELPKVKPGSVLEIQGS